jgi:hypothetical protein
MILGDYTSSLIPYIIYRRSICRLGKQLTLKIYISLLIRFIRKSFNLMSWRKLLKHLMRSHSNIFFFFKLSNTNSWGNFIETFQKSLSWWCRTLLANMRRYRIKLSILMLSCWRSKCSFTVTVYVWWSSNQIWTCLSSNSFSFRSSLHLK